jgi:hypothetical protein
MLTDLKSLNSLFVSKMLKSVIKKFDQYLWFTLTYTQPTWSVMGCLVSGSRRGRHGNRLPSPALLPPNAYPTLFSSTWRCVNKLGAFVLKTVVPQRIRLKEAVSTNICATDISFQHPSTGVETNCELIPWHITSLYESQTPQLLQLVLTET